MPIPTVRPNEVKDDFIQRCVSEEISYGKSESVAVGMCYSLWEQDKLSRMKSLKDMVKKS